MYMRPAAPTCSIEFSWSPDWNDWLIGPIMQPPTSPGLPSGNIPLDMLVTMQFLTVGTQYTAMPLLPPLAVPSKTQLEITQPVFAADVLPRMTSNSSLESEECVHPWKSQFWMTI